MMPATLYHAPLTCSLAARFAAAEGGVDLNLAVLNLRTKDLVAGGSLYDVNPLGQVSVLRLENGELLTETSTVILWIQSQATTSGFRRAPEDPDYFQLVRWLGFCATELHKQIFRVVFYPEATEPVKDRIRGLAPQRFDLLEDRLAQRPFLLGESFSAADAYLAWFFVLAEKAQLDPSGYPNLAAYQARVLNRPLIAALIDEDSAKDRALDQQILPA